MTKSSINKPKFEDTPAFNMWQDREDMADVESYVEQLRKQPRKIVFEKSQLDMANEEKLLVDKKINR